MMYIGTEPFFFSAGFSCTWITSSFAVEVLGTMCSCFVEGSSLLKLCDLFKTAIINKEKKLLLLLLLLPLCLLQKLESARFYQGDCE